MARRRGKASVLDDLMELLAWLPWWVGVLLAIAGYVVLNRLANAPLPVAGTPQDIAHMAAHGIWQGLAHAGQFIVPLICAMGALASAMRRRERRRLIDTACRSTAADALHGMDWKEFERLVGEGFRRQGYLVAETGGGGADGGVDLVLGKAGEKFLVQCKQWKAFKVGVAVVRELYGVMAARGAAGGFVVTSGSFTQEATEFASGRNIQLIDGPALLRLIRQGRSAPEPLARAQAHAHANTQAQPAEQPAGNGPTPTPTLTPDPTPDPASGTEAPPSCPVCAQPMVRRVARRGASAGHGFWGCSGYPRCRGTRPL
ncbi:restriction endonuclease [Paracidovorax oryzae]|uniref:restriction endonuclease n=1 Tax=Paracidovorax oryzae TaxID=862720 RepID=UPI00047D383D|nr:restriction endonuclease [Paracidovorax oryzae]